MLSELTDNAYVERIDYLNQLVEDVRETPRNRSDVKYYVETYLADGLIDEDETGWFSSALKERYNVR